MKLRHEIDEPGKSLKTALAVAAILGVVPGAWGVIVAPPFESQSTEEKIEEARRRDPGGGDWARSRYGGAEQRDIWREWLRTLLERRGLPRPTHDEVAAGANDRFRGDAQ